MHSVWAPSTLLACNNAFSPLLHGSGQNLVKLHGGSVRVESVLGKGSTFIVSLPLGSAHLPAELIGGNRTLASTAVGGAPFVEEALRWLPDAGATGISEQISTTDELMPVPCPPLSQEGATSERTTLHPHC